MESDSHPARYAMPAAKRLIPSQPKNIHLLNMQMNAKKARTAAKMAEANKFSQSMCPLCWLKNSVIVAKLVRKTRRGAKINFRSFDLNILLKVKFFLFGVNPEQATNKYHGKQREENRIGEGLAAAHVGKAEGTAHVSHHRDGHKNRSFIFRKPQEISSVVAGKAWQKAEHEIQQNGFFGSQQSVVFMYVFFGYKNL